METAYSFQPKVPAPLKQETEFMLRGMSVSEYLESGVLVTVSPWIIDIFAQESLESGYRHAMIDSSFKDERINDVIANWHQSEEWRMPTVTELVTFAVEKLGKGSGPLVALTPHTVGPARHMKWVPAVIGDLLAMWPVNVILPKGSSLLLVRT